MKGSEVLGKILSGNKSFVQGERTGVCNPVDVDLGPVVNPVLGEGKDVDGAMHDAVDATVRYTMARILERSTVIAAAVRKGDLLVKGAVYSLSTNEVTILEEEG